MWLHFRLSATRTRISGLMSVAGSRSGLTPRPNRKPSAAPSQASGGTIFRSDQWWLYPGGTSRRYDWQGKTVGWVEAPIVSAEGRVVDVAVTIEEIGRGAERVVYELRHYLQEGGAGGAVRTVGGPLVAKESLYSEDDALRRDFHYIFCKVGSIKEMVGFSLSPTPVVTPPLTSLTLPSLTDLDPRSIHLPIPHLPSSHPCLSHTSSTPPACLLSHLP